MNIEKQTRTLSFNINRITDMANNQQLQIYEIRLVDI